MAYSLPVLGWDAVRLSDSYTLAELNTLRGEVESDPASANPGHAKGSINIFTKAARRRLDALAWAVTYKLRERGE